MALAEIVSISIQAGTVNPARVGFGVPLIMAYHTAWAGSEVRSYATFSGLAADFPSNTAGQRTVNLLAAQLFNQNPRPPKIKVGRLPAPSSAQQTILDHGDRASGVDIVGSIVGPDGTATAIDVTWTTDLATTLGLLKTAIDAITGLTSTVASPLVTVDENVTDGHQFYFSFTTVGVDVRSTTLDWAYDTALDAALDTFSQLQFVASEPVREEVSRLHTILKTVMKSLNTKAAAEEHEVGFLAAMRAFESAARLELGVDKAS